MVKKIARFFISSLVKGVGLIFFDRKYLKSYYFSGRLGWKWMWRSIFFQKILRINAEIPFPVSPNISISNYKNLVFDIDDLNNFQVNGSYFQNFNGCIYIGKGTYIAPNVGIITSNHNKDDLDIHDPGKDVVIGKKCWIGMNSVILPGVVLGDNTIVGAGSVVTKSFNEGGCVIAGNPAKIIRERACGTK